MEEVSVQYQGFSPSSFAQSYVNDVLKQLREESPVNATIRAQIWKTDGRFKGILRIHSHAGKFFVTASGNGLPQLTTAMLSRMRRQLVRWKEERFRSPSSGRKWFQRDEPTHSLEESS